jgi:hypothetical protein
MLTIFWISFAVDVLSLMIVVPALVVEYRHEAAHDEPD